MMGVHTRASQIVEEHGFKPTMAHRSERAGAMNITYDRAVEELKKALSLEGLVRVYALLESAEKTSSPKYAIGTGGSSFKNALRRAIDGHPDKVAKDQAAAKKAEKDARDQLLDVRKQLNEALGRVDEIIGNPRMTAMGK